MEEATSEDPSEDRSNVQLQRKPPMFSVQRYDSEFIINATKNNRYFLHDTQCSIHTSGVCDCGGNFVDFVPVSDWGPPTMELHKIMINQHYQQPRIVSPFPPCNDVTNCPIITHLCPLQLGPDLSQSIEDMRMLYSSSFSDCSLATSFDNIPSDLESVENDGDIENPEANEENPEANESCIAEASPPPQNLSPTESFTAVSDISSPLSECEGMSSKNMDDFLQNLGTCESELSVSDISLSGSPELITLEDEPPASTPLFVEAEAIPEAESSRSNSDLLAQSTPSRRLSLQSPPPQKSSCMRPFLSRRSLGGGFKKPTYLEKRKTRRPNKIIPSNSTSTYNQACLRECARLGLNSDNLEPPQKVLKVGNYQLRGEVRTRNSLARGNHDSILTSYEDNKSLVKKRTESKSSGSTTLRNKTNTKVKKTKNKVKPERKRKTIVGGKFIAKSKNSKKSSRKDTLASTVIPKHTLRKKNFRFRMPLCSSNYPLNFRLNPALPSLRSSPIQSPPEVPLVNHKLEVRVQKPERNLPGLRLKTDTNFQNESLPLSPLPLPPEINQLFIGKEASYNNNRRST